MTTAEADAAYLRSLDTIAFERERIARLAAHRSAEGDARGEARDALARLGLETIRRDLATLAAEHAREDEAIAAGRLHPELAAGWARHCDAEALLAAAKAGDAAALLAAAGRIHGRPLDLPPPGSLWGPLFP